MIRNEIKLFEPAISKNKKVAVIGAGPAGISCACELRLKGYEVDLFEAKDLPGGLALYGCAPYKVTNDEILSEIHWLQEQLGFKIHYGHPINSREAIVALETKYDAIFLGIGLGNTQVLNIDTDWNYCIGATEFIQKVKMDPGNVETGKKVIVIGGGNTAIDAATESAKLGAEEVILAYRRAREEMPAYSFEYELAKSAGVRGLFNVVPTEIKTDGSSKILTFSKTKVENGRVLILTGTEFTITCDTVILATGQEKMKTFLSLIENLELNPDGSISVDPATCQTTNPKYFAGGDAMNGGAEVVNAAAEGKAAALGIHTWLQEDK
jgi:glutamate synthase (NADPH/NADH) small chain